MDKITGVLIDVENGEATVVSVDRTLQGYYDILNCDTIDIITRQLNFADGKTGDLYTIICDDEGLFKENAVPSAMNSKAWDHTAPVAEKIALVGNLFFCKSDGEDMVSLTELECIDVLAHCYRYSKADGFTFFVVHGVDFPPY